MSEGLDLYADENEPEVQQMWTTYRLTVPRLRMALPTKEIPFVYIDVDEYGLVNIDQRHTIWFGEHVDLRATISIDDPPAKSVYQLQREIMDWLVEWEFAVWRNIGPEDRELFATKKLTGRDVDDYE